MGFSYKNKMFFIHHRDIFQSCLGHIFHSSGINYFTAVVAILVLQFLFGENSCGVQQASSLNKGCLTRLLLGTAVTVSWWLCCRSLSTWASCGWIQCTWAPPTMVKQSLEEAGLAQEWEINMHVLAATSCSGWKTLEEWMCCGNTPSSAVSSKTRQLLFLRTLIFHKPFFLLRKFAAEAQPLKSLYCSPTEDPSTNPNYPFLKICSQNPILSTSGCLCSS